MPSRLGQCLLWLAWALSNQLSAQEAAEYEQHVKPLFAARCVACHGVLKQEAGLRLDTGQLARQGSDNGPVINAEDVDGSGLLQRVTATDVSQRMPPEGEPLTAEQLRTLRVWIAAGAKSPADEQPEADPREHWAFKTVQRPRVPHLPRWGVNPIDAFVAAGHAANGLREPQPAGRRELIRRLYIDLLGVPPTLDDWNAAAQAGDDGWYERLVDRLLEDPRYGQRWARHWMDIWRYSDWWGLGQQLRNSQLHMWHWRDWIVESLNQDVPYDQMVRLMLAADELTPTDQSQLRATGYLARNYFLFNRHQWMDETVEHVGKGLLGLTMNCAKCHDHKYDPVNQIDYYRMRAFFEPYHVRMDMMPGQSDMTRDGLPRVFEAQGVSPTYLFIRGQETQPDKSSVIAPGIPDIIAFDKIDIEPMELPAAAWQPERQPFVAQAYLDASDRQIESAAKAVEKAHKNLRDLQTKAANEGKAKAAPIDNEPIFEPLVERFEKLDLERWQLLDGQWEHQSGVVRQLRDGPTHSILRLRSAIPQDFQATLKFTILGGSRWRSVCLSFDAVGTNLDQPAVSDTLQTIYVSAVEGGSKLQGSISRNGKWEYPSNATVPRPIPLNEAQTLKVQVRGDLINAYLNDELLLAWQTPLARRSGAFQLVTFDALAAFHSLEIKALEPSVSLRSAEEVSNGGAGRLAAAEREAEFAERELKLATQEKELLVARLAAQRADWQLQDAQSEDEKSALTQSATEAHRQALTLARTWEVAKAQLTLDRLEATLEQQAGSKRAAAEKQAKSAREALEKAQKTLASELKPTDKAAPVIGARWAATRFLNSGADDPAVTFGPKSSGRRTALARWITDKRNPLTARVAVNHLWTRHFGTSLVETPFDFGRKTSSPRNQQLLDWLAAEFMESGWSMHHMHRVIVLSQTYRMSSTQADSAQNMTVDPDNHWLWRRDPIRIESQVVRDGVLALAGTLDCSAGGPPIMPDDQAASRRRSLYFFHSNNERNLFLTTFDEAPVKECYRREQSIVPQQALALTNSQLVLDSAGLIAQKLISSLPPSEKSDDRKFVEQAFLVILGIEPSAAEVQASTDALRQWREVGDGQKRTPYELLVWALLNHNDFVTLR